MYGQRRANYNSRPQVMETPLEESEAPEGSANNDYFNFMNLPWQNQQNQSNIGSSTEPSTENPSRENSNGFLDPIDELERDLMEFDNTEFPELMTPVGAGMPEIPLPNQQQMNSQMGPQINQPVAPAMNHRNVTQNQQVNQMNRGVSMNAMPMPHMNQMNQQLNRVHPQMNNQLGSQMSPQMRQHMMNGGQMNQVGQMNQLNRQQQQMYDSRMAEFERQRQQHQQHIRQQHQHQQHPYQSPRQAHMRVMESSMPIMTPPASTQPPSRVQSRNAARSHSPSLQTMTPQPTTSQSVVSQPVAAQNVAAPVHQVGSVSMLVHPSVQQAPQVQPLHTPPIASQGVQNVASWMQNTPRVRYKPRSSIPPDLSSANYAAQCIAAAESSRLSPYSLSLGEYNHLRNILPHVHVTTYLNIRNGILRLWLANPLVSVTIVEAAGCCKEARYYPLAEFAFEWLVRNGYINQGCYTHVNRTNTSTMASLPKFNHRKRKPRQTIVVVGAGVAGLSCARQLENLLERYSSQILVEYEELPRVLVLEGRKRIGGRIYSPMLSTERTSVDLGGDTIMGFGGGNPLGVVMRRQLGIPVVSVDTTSERNVLHSSRSGDPIGAQVDYRAHEMFKYLLDRMKNFEMGQSPSCISGVKSLLRASQDPKITDAEQEKVTIGQFEEEEEKPYANPVSDDSDSGEQVQQAIELELDFLEGLGFQVHRSNPPSEKETRVHAEQADQGPSLGLTMNKVVEHLGSLTDLSEDDLDALNWYFAKFEYQIGDNIDKASLSSWSHHRQNRFSGRYAWARDGMSTLAKGLDTVPGKLDVRFKTVVNVIEYEDDSAEITLENGEQVHVDRCVITVPLGCLKRRSMQFIPDLPKWKSDSIDRLEFGVVNKVVLVFDEPFWDVNDPSLIRVANEVGRDGHAKDKRGDCFVFQNHAKRCDIGTKALMVGLVSGASASEFTDKTDYEITERAVSKLRHIFRKHPKAQTSKLVESIVTRWQIDRFSRGTYSHVGVEGTSTDHDLLARPVQRSLFFAGEATSRAFPGTVHGAYISGLRAAKEVLNSLVGGIEMPEKIIDDDLANNIMNITAERTSDEQSDGGNGSGAASVQPEEISDAAVMNVGASSKDSSTVNAVGTAATLSQISPHMTSMAANPNIAPVGVTASSVPTNSAAGSTMPMHPPSRTISPLNTATKRTVQSPESMYSPIVDYDKAEKELSDLRKHRRELKREQLDRDMMHEIGQRPVKPERHGITNPFLLFQKDYWEICRQETEAHKLKEKKGGGGTVEFHASRNEIRAGLGKKWRSLPDDQRAPYIERSRQAKVENEERQETYIRKLKWYESEAANFQQQWEQEHPSQPTPREKQLESQLEMLKPKKKRSRLTE